MKAHLIPYSEIFVSMIMSLDEAAVLNDTLATLKEKKGTTLQKQADEMRAELEDALIRAVELKQKRWY